MYDISASGNVHVVITQRGASEVIFEPSDFSADGSPVRFGREEVANGRIDMNGDMFSEHLRRPLTVELYPIPNTDADRDFTRMLLNCWGDQATIDKMIVEWTLYLGDQSTKSSLIFYDGIVSNGSFGNDASQEGRFTTNPYVFKFAKVSGTPNSMMQWKESKGSGSDGGEPQKQRKLPKKTMKPGAIFYLGQNSPNNIYQMARW